MNVVGRNIEVSNVRVFIVVLFVFIVLLSWSEILVLY